PHRHAVLTLVEAVEEAPVCLDVLADQRSREPGDLLLGLEAAQLVTEREEEAMAVPGRFLGRALPPENRHVHRRPAGVDGFAVHVVEDLTAYGHPTNVAVGPGHAHVDVEGPCLHRSGQAVVKHRTVIGDDVVPGRLEAPISVVYVQPEQLDVRRAGFPLELGYVELPAPDRLRLVGRHSVAPSVRHEGTLARGTALVRVVWRRLRAGHTSWERRGRGDDLDLLLSFRRRLQQRVEDARRLVHVEAVDA